ncbi:MAG TPA: PLP-dependent aminotransferase family protein [Rhodopila sp.]|uniref:aminotransferase-like domain-containing protein n=1 Tax=Rhodopila sp. TaxID=2480087 RepID=UPI002C57E01A|nr:PLP-dependent aminotransferase family protein [Rhodopila sp.]HVY17192.1 PLP-dependent aminotransferase family protein [Rhodopila sp.]
MTDWTPDLSQRGAPRYLAIADAIAADIEAGRLAPSERLPPQRVLASALGMDFTTVARGYVEAKRRGLIESRVGQGTFVSGSVRRRHAAMARHPEIVDLSMNLPPEPDDQDLLDRMQDGWDAVSRDLVSLLRYQGFGGVAADKAAASAWLSRRGLVPQQDRVFITPGAHPALNGILGLLAKPGDTILSEDVTYPGTRSIAGQLGLTLLGLPMDDDGIVPDAFAEACARHTPKALYLNPTLLNPTTHTIPERRRLALTEVARRFAMPIIEDDPYGLLPPEAPAAFAALAPELTWHVAGLAKCLGAGLRIAYVIAPDNRSGWSFAAALRAATVMASPITAALATRWITDGTGDALLAAVRRASVERQALAREALRGATFRADPFGFHLWLNLPAPWTRSAFVGHMRDRGIGVTASDAFTVTGPPPEAVRVCLGGPAGWDQLREALEFMAHSLAESPSTASHFL